MQQWDVLLLKIDSERYKTIKKYNAKEYNIISTKLVGTISNVSR